MTDSEDSRVIIASSYAWTDEVAWKKLEDRLMDIEDRTGVMILVDDTTKFIEIVGKDNDALREARVEVQRAINRQKVTGDDISRLEGDELRKFILAHQSVTNGTA